MLRGVMVAAVLVGCAEVPEGPNPRTPGITAEGNAFNGAGIALAFAETGIRLPESLMFDGHEIFAANACPRPSLAGIAIEPFQTAYGGHEVPGATSTLDVLMPGPAVVQVEVRYDLPYDCFGKQSLQGSSTFTMFPSGRIVRQDSVKPTTTTITDAVMCNQTCNSAPMDNATLSVHWALDGTGGERLTPTGPLSTNAASIPFSCTRYGTHNVGINWDVVPTVTSTKSSEINGAFVAEYTFLDKRTTVAPTTEVARSTLYVSVEDDCAELQTEMRLPQRILVDDEDVMLDMFDIYTDTNARSGRMEIKPVPGQPIPTGFALRTRLDTSHLRARHSNGDEALFAVQPDGPGVTILWIDSQIPEDGSILIEAL